MTIANIVNVATINGRTVAGPLVTGGTVVVDVPVHSVAKINNIIIANIDGTNSATVTAEVSVNDGTTFYAIAKTVAVPADATLMLIDKTTGFYLDETDQLKLTASADDDLTYLVSYEEIID